METRTKMQIHSLTQGTDAWHQFRLQHFGASEAAAMLGLSKNVKRTELLHMKHTGTAKEFSDWVQANILDYGHEVEAKARPLAENIIDDELYPVTCSNNLLHALCSHQLSASLDGLTMNERILFEHKQWAQALAASVAAGVLPEEHAPQCQQELLVTGAEKLLFVVSDGTEENMVYKWVYPDHEWFDRIIAGWEQFDKDLETYEPTVYAERPIAEAIKQLPALAIQINGEVVRSNLPMFQAAAERFIETIKTDLTTDEDFVTAEANVRFCKTAEEDLESAKIAAIKQTASIDDLMRTVDFIKDKLRTKRLTLEKLVESQKKSLKEAILLKAKLAFSGHVDALEKEIAPIRLICAPPDFAAAMKAKRTLASLNDAAETALANGKIGTDAIGKDLRAKLAWIKENHGDFGFLFKDLQQIIYKADDDFRLVVTSRVDEHKAEQKKKDDAIAAKAVQNEKDRVEELEKAKVAAETPAPAAVVQESISAQKTLAVTPMELSTGGSMRSVPRAASVPVVDVNEGPSDIEIIELIASSYDLTPQKAIARVAKIMLVAARDHFSCQTA